MTKTHDHELDRLRVQNQALMKLALEGRQHPLGDLGQSMAQVTEVGVAALGVERVSIWLMDASGQSMTCMDLFERDQHHSGERIEGAAHKAYFEAMASERIIDASDAREDPRTQEFLEDYLIPRNIYSMLDAPIFVSDERRGVVCLESVGQRRDWSEEDKAFAASLADLVAATLAARERREASDAISALLKTATQGVLYLSETGDVLRANSTAVRMFRCEGGSLVGRNIADLIPRDAQSESLHEALRTKSTLRMLQPVTALRTDSSSFLAEVSLGSSEWRTRPLTLVMLSDVTERYENQRLLREREELYRNVVDDLTDFILRAVPGGQLTFVNRAACEYFGATPEAAIEKTVYDFSPPEDHATIREAAARLTPDAPVLAYEARGLRPNQQAVECKWTLRGLFDEAGHLTGYQAIGRDITDERVNQARLREAQRMEALAVLAGGLAHDFNNLLTPILGFTELVATNMDSKSQDAERLMRVLSAGVRARDLVHQVLLFSRRDVDVERSAITAAHYIRETMQFLESSIPAHIQVRTSVEEDCGAIIASPSDIYQVLSNLCTNAYQAMPAGGVLEVSATKVERELPDQSKWWLQIIVRDSGHGIDPETREHIFEPFYTTKEPGSGTGLGLSVVHGVIKELGGSVDVQSAPGQGTSFVVYLPCQDYSADLSRVADVQPSHAWTGDERILVVDDELEVTRLISSALSPVGYRIDGRNSANEGLATLQRDPDGYDLLITDYTMPFMTGIELAWKARKLSPDIPIVLLSGFSHLAREPEFEAAGIDGFLRKPFRTEELARAIRTALERRRER